MKVILETGNPSYYANRAIEMIRDAESNLEAAIKFVNIQDDPEQHHRHFNTVLDFYHDGLKKAISLLALARVKQLEPINTGDLSRG